MTKYLIQRVLISIPVLVGVTIIIFFFANAMPGNAVLAMITSESPVSEDLIRIRQGQLGLDDPLPVQYLRWIGNVLRGNLGYSYVNGTPISDMIIDRIPATVQLMGISLLISIIVGTILGIISALKRYSWWDYVLTITGFIGLSMPVFFLGMVLVYVFALKLGWLPTSGRVTSGEPYNFVDNMRHLILPAVCLALVRIPVFMRYTRASMLEILYSDHVRTARSKGLFERTILVRHTLRNALIPVITVIGLTLPVLFSGAIIIESVFQWPGIGLLYISSITQRDIPILMGITMITGVLVLVSNLLTDIAYSVVDPRIRYD
ncbi:MAG: ABC transporter permease [Burkholderiales bacterium]|nr:ABC transporter permease [Anaerolineae bacterium]